MQYDQIVNAILRRWLKRRLTITLRWLVDSE